MKLSEEYPGFEEYSLVTDDDGGICLWGFGEYESSSVLAGSFRQTRLNFYENKQKAEKETGLKVGAGSEPFSSASLPDVPPVGFDPTACGEVWGEDEY